MVYTVYVAKSICKSEKLINSISKLSTEKTAPSWESVQHERTKEQ